MSGLESELEKRVDDAVREELLLLGRDYDETIAEVSDQGRESVCTVRFHGEYPEIEIAIEEGTTDDESLRARVRRRLRVALEGPDPLAEPIDAGC